MAELAHATTGRVTVHEVTDYVFGGFQGDLPCPPHADLNPRKAFIICWRDFPFRFVFSHEASYCPWFELPSGGAVSFQFFEGNLGWAELFNNFGRQEQNSSIEILEAGPERVKVRWTYYGVNMETGRRAYRGVEDFWAYPNGLIVRRQTFETLLPDDPRGYARAHGIDRPESGGQVFARRAAARSELRRATRSGGRRRVLRQTVRRVLETTT